MIRSLLSCLLMLQVLLFSLQVATVQARADAATEYRIQTFPLERNGMAPVSYTHLDVYKRQNMPRPLPFSFLVE